MLVAFRLFHSVGYRRGYGDAMADVVKGERSAHRSAFKLNGSVAQWQEAAGLGPVQYGFESLRFYHMV